MKTRIAFTSLLFVVLAGCQGLLDVNNPNNLLEADLNGDPNTATGIVNGANGTVVQGIGYVLAPYETATDEVYWIGSRDAWVQLDKGGVSDYNNEFTDQAWPYITEGRYMADKAVTLLEGWDNNGVNSRLSNRLDLARAYLYAGLVRIFIAETFADFVFSDKTTLGMPFGESNLFTLCDQAVTLLGKGLTIAQTGSTAAHIDLQRKILGVRARAYHTKAMRQKLLPGHTVPANPYVSDVNAFNDATAALAVMGGATSDFKWKIDYFSVVLFNEFAWETIGRSELQLERIPNDPILGAADTRMRADSTDFKNRTAYSDRYSPLTMISAREMRLIQAEYYLAQAIVDSTNARARLNEIRALNSLTPIAVTNDIFAAFVHERRAGTYLQGRRLLDMYRFNIKDTRWVSTSEAYTLPGTLLPITIIERRANPNVQ